MTEARQAVRRRTHFLLSIKRATGRLFTSVALGGVAVFAATPSTLPWWVRAVVGWDVGALALLALAWHVIFRADARETRHRAGSDDPGRTAVFGIALVSSLVSLFAATFVLHYVRKLPGSADELRWTLLTLAAVALSWALTHTAYTLRYAHLHYRAGSKSGGLQFPGEDPPADIDFAYFSFTIGMCFQVSDVVVTTTPMRRAVLLHAFLSFVYNTTILALALNLAFGLMG